MVCDHGEPRRGGVGRVLAFEPNPDTYALLVCNMTLSGCSNVWTVGGPLTDVESEALLYQGPVDGGAGGLAPMKGWRDQAKVHLRRLDDVLGELGCPVS